MLFRKDELVQHTDLLGRVGNISNDACPCTMLCNAGLGVLDAGYMFVVRILRDIESVTHLQALLTEASMETEATR
jgi:hypothetical protein